VKVTLLFLPAALAAIIAYALTPATCVLARRIGAIDAPNPRKMHGRPTPRLGGLAVVSALLLTIGSLCLFQLPGYPALSSGLCIALTAGLLPILGVSCWDDVRSVRPTVKLAGQIAGAVIAVVAGVRLDHAVHLFGQTIPLDGLAVPLSILWIVGVTNAFNIVDGLDGLSAGLALISAASLATVAALTTNPEIALVSLVVLGAVAGFLPYNTHPARVFLGDCGATAVGFYLACLALPGGSTLSSGMAVLVPLLVMGVPVADTIVSILRRFIRALQQGTVPALFQADSEHIHHRLVRLGLDHRRAVLVLYAAGVVAAGSGIVSLFMTERNAGILLATLIAAGFIGVSRLGYHEFAILRRGIVLKVSDRAAIKSGHFRVFVDMGLVMFAFYGAVALKYDDWDLDAHRILFQNSLVILLPVNVAVFWVLRLYRRSWRFARIDDVIGVNGAVAVASAVGLVLVRLFDNSAVSVNLFAMYTLLLILGMNAGRSSFRVAAYLKRANRAHGRRVAIYGAGARGVTALREMQTNEALDLLPVGFVDDDRSKAGRRVDGLRVLGDVTELSRLIREYRLGAFVLASDKITTEHIVTAMHACDAAGIALLQFDIGVRSVSSRAVSVQPVVLSA